MTVTQDLSVFGMISNASLLVQLVMALLLLISAMSWTYIFRKMFSIRNAIARTTEFETIFWSGANLYVLYEEVTSGRRQQSGKSGALEHIFEAGMEEYRKARQTFTGKDIDVSALLDGARRAGLAANSGAVERGPSDHHRLGADGERLDDVAEIGRAHV